MVLEKTLIGTNQHREDRESFRLNTQASSQKQGAEFLDQMEQAVVHKQRDHHHPHFLHHPASENQNNKCDT